MPRTRLLRCAAIPYAQGTVSIVGYQPEIAQALLES
jgi:hypothetical protein